MCEMSVTEPPIKRAKLDLDTNLMIQNLDNHIQNINVSTEPLKVIIADDIFNPVPTTNAYVGHIKDPTFISKAILLLNEKIPLKCLRHLKRVKGREVILCPVDFLNGALSIQKYLEHNVSDLNDIFEYFKEVTVPSLPPKVKSQYKEANKMWSVNFHPDKYLENIVNNKIFDNGELKQHRQLMALTFEVAKWYILRHELPTSSVTLEDINVAVVFDPIVSSVVAVAIDNRWNHPMQHAAMLVIDNVAKTQNAGAWMSEEEKHELNRTNSGFDKELYTYLSESFPSIKFGARAFEKRSKSGLCEQDISYGPYLCTGYYVYLMREPCVMCSMGLIHARINRTFFCFENKNYGALKSKTMLHLNPSLNHHFETFTGFL